MRDTRDNLARDGGPKIKKRKDHKPERKKRQLIKLLQLQDGKCFWCCIVMVIVGKPSSLNPTAATIDHLDSRLSLFRGQYQGKFRHVAACWRCNNERNRMELARTPIEELRERSKGSRHS